MNILHARSPSNNGPRSCKFPTLREVPCAFSGALLAAKDWVNLQPRYYRTCYDRGQTLSQVPVMSQLDQRTFRVDGTGFSGHIPCNCNAHLHRRSDCCIAALVAWSAPGEALTLTYFSALTVRSPLERRHQCINGIADFTASLVGRRITVDHPSMTTCGPRLRPKVRKVPEISSSRSS